MKINLSDFRFEFNGHGHYRVSYTSPKTGKVFTCVTSDMPLIDSTKNSDNPKQKDLNILKAKCKPTRF